MIKEMTARDMKHGEEPQNREATFKRVMLTMEQSYNNSLDSMTTVQRLLDYCYFRGDLYMAVEKPEYTLYDYILESSKEALMGCNDKLQAKVYRQVAENLRKTLKKLSRLGIMINRNQIDPRTIGLQFS
jgi:hypothetical protein